jgi:hypothetical protein
MNHNLFSTNKFRVIRKNDYNNKEECKKNSRKWFQTNPRYPLFNQTLFHAADYIDIDRYGLLPTMYYYSMNSSKKHNSSNSGDSHKNKKIFKLYKNIHYKSVANTFSYIFHKFKKGIYVIIHDNQVKVFLPFSNANYKNNWVKQTYLSLEEKKLLENNKYEDIKHLLNKNIIEFQKKYPDQFNSQYKKKIDFNRDHWVGNNCFFRNQYPVYEGQLVLTIFKNMLEELVKHRKIPDVEFFINNRDFPILKKNYTEPYEHIFDSDKIKIEKEFQFKTMAPIFSRSITDEYADMMIPTQDDWYVASGKYFSNSGCSDSYDSESMKKINRKFDTKKNSCIFRGSATGCGITLDNNMRLKAAKMSLEHRELLDAGITDWNARMKKYKGNPIDIIDVNELGFGLTNKITNFEKSNYKYILNIDGHVSAFRLSSELSMMSVILLVKSNYYVWYTSMLEEYVHYVPIKEDLSNLIDQIKWCIKNDDKCKKIAKNAFDFYHIHINKNGIFNYLEKQFQIIHQNRQHKNLLDVVLKKKKVAIITIFRDSHDGEREKQRKIFIEMMNSIVSKYCDYHIYIIEQSDDGELFNIGKLKNIGFEIASKKEDYDSFVFSDIDTLPNYDLVPYFLKKSPYPISLAARGTRYSEKNKKIEKPFLGALISFTKKLFIKLNGYPNNFWGWGGEDDSLFIRLHQNNIHTISIPEKGASIDMEESNHKKIDIPTKIKILLKNKKDELKFEKLHGDIQNYKKNGLSNLQYKIISTTKINSNSTQIKVDLLKKKDMEMFPEWFPTRNTNYQKKQDEIITIYKKICHIII